MVRILIGDTQHESRISQKVSLENTKPIFFYMPESERFHNRFILLTKDRVPGITYSFIYVFGVIGEFIGYFSDFHLLKAPILNKKKKPIHYLGITITDSFYSIHIGLTTLELDHVYIDDPNAFKWNPTCMKLSTHRLVDFLERQLPLVYCSHPVDTNFDKLTRDLILHYLLLHFYHRPDNEVLVGLLCQLEIERFQQMGLDPIPHIKNIHASKKFFLQRLPFNTLINVTLVNLCTERLLGLTSLFTKGMDIK